MLGLDSQPNQYLSGGVCAVGNRTYLKMSIKKPSFEEKNSVSRIGFYIIVTPLTKAGDLTIILLYGVSEGLEKPA